MSCIVGLAQGGTVWLGADSAASTDERTDRYKAPKVFRRGSLLFGVVQSFRMRDILHHDLQPSRRKAGLADETYLVQYLVEDIRGAFDAAKFDLDDEGDDCAPGAVLIGYHGRLWTMDWDFHLGETRDGFTAIGSGSDYALGALHALQRGHATIEGMAGGLGMLPPKQRIVRALEASVAYSPSVLPPFKILSIR